LLEAVYRTCLTREMAIRGLRYACEVPIPLAYKGASLETSYRADIIVEGAVLVELKAVDRLLPIHEAQLLTYLKLSRLRIGLLINFNAASLKHGIRRFIM
jgi:GxxExxY protein